MLKLLAVVAAALLAVAGPAAAQADYPARPVTIVVPFPPGGSADLITRVLAEEFAKLWKQQVVVENKPGGATSIGIAFVSRAKPDGYTLLAASSGFVILPAVQRNLPFDPNDITAIGQFVDSPLALVVGPSVKATNLQELIAEAKSRTMTFSTPGAASTSRMASELFQRQAGITMKHIAYSGETLSIPDLISGRIDLQVGTWGAQRPHVDQGKLRIISVLASARLPDQPNVPLMSESISGMEAGMGSFNSLAAPAGTPKEIIAKISADMKTITSSASYRDRVLALNNLPRFTTPEELAEKWRNDRAKWTEIAREANIKVD